MASVINTGISALNAFKRQMETTGHNIANVNTEGYSRQRVELDTRRPQETLQGYIGSGVDVSSIRRSYDDFLALRVRDYRSLSEESAMYDSRAKQIDNVLADEAAGISGVMQQFFAAVNDVANDPTSIEARSVLLNRSDQLADRFNQLDQWLTDLRRRLNQDLGQEVNEINSLAEGLVDINRQIGSLNGLSGGVPPDILDARDQLLDELSRYTNVSAVVQQNGMVDVSVGTGQVLVLGVNRNVMAVEPNLQAPDRMELTIQTAGGAPIQITEQLSGGRLGGLLRFRDEILDESHNALGRVAIGISDFFNAQHRLGMDLDGDPGGDFFVPVSGPQVLGDGNVTGGFTNVADLTTHEYQLENTAGGWVLTDLTTRRDVPITVTTVGTTQTIVADTSLGFELTVGDTGLVGPNDSYRIRPGRLGANEFAVGVTDERDFAAALPTGAGPAVGDNRNARALANLQTANLMIGGTATLANTYGALIADVGTLAQQARSNAEIQESLLAQTEAAKSEVSGVNLDEEAANLVRFQQAYQAAAQVISVANTLFDSLIGAVRR